MESKKVLSALSYFSIFFAGFIFPLVVFFVSDDSEVKGHAKKAFFSHLIPLISIPLLALSTWADFAGNNLDFPLLTIMMGIGTVLLSIVVVIWNIVKGIKVLL